MQIATLNYQYNPKENGDGNYRAKLNHRRVLTTITSPQKKSKQRQSLHSDLTAHLNGPLPPIAKSGQPRNSIRIKGSSLTSSKLGETSNNSFYHQSRSHSRQSNKSEVEGVRSRSISPAGSLRPTSKLVRLKFGYPVKIRSADFYSTDKDEAQLHLREESFVNDSVRSAHQTPRLSIIPHYEALDDPHLRRFFQSPIVLDIVRKTINVDVNNSYKQDERFSKSSKIKKQPKSNGLYHDYRQIVSKGSSGYAKLNGYDCIPTYSPARHYYRRSSTVDPTLSNSQRWNTTESRLHNSTAQDKYQASAHTSITSFPIDTNNQLQKKKKTRKHDKSNQLKPLATSSPLRHSITTTKTDDNAPEQKNDFPVASTVSQD